MPKERYRRNLHEEDRQVFEYTDSPKKAETIKNLEQRSLALQKETERARGRGDKEYVGSLLKQRNRTIGILRKLAESNSRR